MSEAADPEAVGAATVSFGDRLDLDEAGIARVVRAFYERAREDEVIGPVFASAVHDWDRHVETITAFWSGILLRTGGYDGRPLRPHLLLGIGPAHFDRWLDLFEATVRDLCPPDVAVAFVFRARRIADSFEMAVASTRGDFARPRHGGRPGFGNET